MCKGLYFSHLSRLYMNIHLTNFLSRLDSHQVEEAVLPGANTKGDKTPATSTQHKSLMGFV